MRPFLTAVVRSFRYRWSIIGAIVSSMMIAVLWGASISTVYPFVEIVLDNQTAHTWIAKEIAENEQQIDRWRQEIARLESAAAVAVPAEQAVLQRQLDLAANRLEAEKNALARYQWLEPYITKFAPHSPFQTLVWALTWLLGTSLLKGVLLVVSTILVARVANRTVMDMRRTYYRKALEMDQRRIDAMGTSNMMTHLSHNMMMVSAGLQAFYGKMLREPLKMAACLIGAAWISLPLLVVSLIIVPLGAYVVHALSQRMKRSTQREMDGMSQVFQTLMESFGEIKTVRVFNRERTERRRFKRNANSLYRISLKISLYDSLLRPTTEMLGIISIALSILVGAYLVLNQKTHLFGIWMCSRPLKPGSLLLFYTFLAGASDPARKMSEVINILVRGGTACENLLKAFGEKPEVVAIAPQASVPRLSQSIVFDHVTFTYRGKTPALVDVSFEVKARESLAIVGANGSGKSTIVNLLLRFYDPHKGRILLDGVDIRHMNPRSLRRQFAWVTQDSVLFKGTIWDNIAYGKHSASREEIENAAKQALVWDFAQSLPQKMDSLVGDQGRLLSAGQRQRVAWARAILADPCVLILDEATSQIDGKTENLLHEGLEPFIRQRTTLIITHRHSSLRWVDRVLVMEQGRLVEDLTRTDATTHSREFQHLFNKSA